MDSDRYQRIKAILLDAMELSGAARAAFLASVCDGDAELQADVESLLAHADGDDFLAPVVPAPADVPSANIDALVGQTVLHFHVTTLVQSGGMGVVYLADDLRLGRRVALKFVRPEFLSEERIKSRFIREATAIAMLAHPNVCTLYEVETTPDGQVFMVMAYYEGETLRAALAAGPLPVAACVDIARQVGNGLAVAHAAGIIHRDIKPANIMLVDGTVKILDFGIARLTNQSGLTVSGASLGTPDYVSPEQLRGADVDGRSDIWSLGIVLYEMLTGRRPFSAFDVVSAPSTREAAVALPPFSRPDGDDVPAELESVIRRALSPDPERRYQAMRDFVRDLDRVAAARSHRVRIAVRPFTSQSLAADARLVEIVTEGVIDALSVSGGCVVRRASNAGDREAVELTGTVSVALETVLIAITVAVGGTRSIGPIAVREPLARLARAVTALVRDVLRALDVRLKAEEARQLQYRAQSDAAAYRAHLEGLRYLLREDGEGAAAACSLFERAMAAAPDAMGPLTHAAMADACVVQIEHACGSREELARQARRELEAAWRLDAATPEVQFAAAAIAFSVDWSPDQAEGRLRSVLAARPGHTRATLRLAECLLATGDGLHAANLARDVVQGGGGGSSETLLRAGRVLYFARQYAEAAAAFAHVIDDRSRAAVARFDLAFTCAKGRDGDRFNAHCDRALALHEGRALAAAAAGNAAKANGNEARHESFRRLLWRLHQHRPVPPCCFTLLDASFGTTGRPIEYLDGFDRTLGLTKFLGFAPIAGSLTSLVPVVGLIAYLGLEPAFDALYRAPAFESFFATALNEPA